MECQYCKKTYSNTYTLKNHQTLTRACLLIQKDLGNKVEPKIFECSFCNKNLSTKARLERHYIICKIKKEYDTKKEIEQAVEEKTKQIIKDEFEEVSFTFRNKQEEYEYEIRLKDEQIKELKERLEQHEKTPKIIKNKTKNITNHINILNIHEVMTPERVEEVFKKHYNLDTLLQGIPGLAKFICDGFIHKSSYFCTDRSRHKFVMNDEHGNKVEDPNCEKLVSLTAPGMKHITDVYETGLFTTNDHISEEDLHKSYQPISNLDRDPSKLTSELSKIVPSDISPVVSNTSSQNHNNVWQMMRDVYKSNSEKSSESIVEQPVLKTIGGFSLGQLMKYREGYRKRKSDAGGKEVEIKGPSLLLELCEKDNTIKEKYYEFIKA
jgi:hypothetical protein